MAKLRSVKFKVPATSANLGPGFDCLAIALSITDEIEMKQSDTVSVTVKGEGEKSLSTDESNLMVKVVEHFYRQVGKPFSGIQIKVKKSIPLTKGLGSSSAAIVGSLYGANELLGRPCKREELFNFATHLEGHPDNVAAAIFGGLTIAWRDNGESKAISFLPPQNLKVILGIPDFEIYTIRARNILPAVWPKEDVVSTLAHACLLTAAFVSKKYDLLPLAMRDRLHEPYRGQLVPGYPAMREEILENGGLGVSISGSGPTVLAFASHNIDKIKKIMIGTFKQNKIKSVALVTKPSIIGVR